MIAWKENSWGGIRKGDDFMIYEFYLDDIIVRCDKCVKDEQNFLHLYRSKPYANRNSLYKRIYVEVEEDQDQA